MPAQPRERKGRARGKGGSAIIKSLKDLKVVRDKHGRTFPLVPGTSVTKTYTIAGKGREKPIRDEPRLLSQYGGIKSKWQKMRGMAVLKDDGTPRKAEIHWYYESSVGYVEFKWKDWY